ncbi:MAG: PAS domain S-box protein [Terracidiphilus sp.]
MLTPKIRLASHRRAKKNRDTSSLRSLLADTRNQSIKCRSSEVDQVVLAALDSVRGLEIAEASGFFAISESGALENLCASQNPSHLERLAARCLQDLPWCLPKLRVGQPVVLRGLQGPHSRQPNGQETSAHGKSRSIAMIPSRCHAATRGLFVLLSVPGQNGWAVHMLREYALLADALWSAYQRKLAAGEGGLNGPRLIELPRISSVGMAVVDENGNFKAANPAFFKATGYAENQLSMKPFELVFSPVDRASGTNVWRRARHMKDGVRQIERKMTRKDGSSASTVIALTPLRDSKEYPVHFLVIIQYLGEQLGASDQQSDSDNCPGMSIASRLIQCQEDERKRLSRELHDGIGQSMSLIASECALLASEYSESSPCLRDRIASLRDHLDQVCSDLHCMSHHLHSYKLQHLGLKCALQDLCRQMSTPELCISLNAENASDPKSEEVALCLYRVAQEAINNSVKHSQTLKVLVTLTELQNTFYMTVRDFGIGFNSSAKHDGLGLVSMRERLTLVNGRLKISSTIGKGTEVWVSVSELHNRPAQNQEIVSPWQDDGVARIDRTTQMARAGSVTQLSDHTKRKRTIGSLQCPTNLAAVEFRQQV